MIIKKTKKHPDNTKLKNYYNKYKNKLTSLVRAAKICFYKKQFSKTINDPKLTWKLINKLTGKNKTNSNEIFKNTLFTNGQHINPQKEPFRAANILNTFFTGINRQIHKKFQKDFYQR